MPLSDPQAPVGARRPSLLAAFTPELQDEREEELDLRRKLARRVLEESTTAEVAHVVLAGLLTIQFWPSVPHAYLLMWSSFVVAATGLRIGTRLRLGNRKSISAEGATVVRFAVLLTAVGWMSGPAFFWPYLDLTDLLLIMVVFAGLVAGATSTLLGDPPSFFGFATILLLPLAVTIVATGDSRTHIVAIVLVGLYGSIVSLIYRRAHSQLRALLKTTANLGMSEAASARGAGYLDALLASTPVAIATLSSSGSVSGINPAFESMFGYTADETVGRSLNELLVPESGREEAALMDTHVHGGDVVVSEVDRRHKDGTIIPVRASATNATGEAEGTTFVLYDDIRALREAEAARREAEIRYRHIVESASELVFEVDADGTWTFLNPACRGIYGAVADELLGTSFTERVDPARLPSDLEVFEAVLHGEKLEDYETVHRSVTDDLKYLSFSVQPLRSPDGMIVGARGTARDVTERAIARAALEEARTEAERAAKTKSAFLANMSHEIRTPMNGILGMTELMLDSDLSAEHRRSLEVVRASAEALLTVINDVLDFSKFDAGRFDLEHIEFDLPGMLESAVRLLGTRAADQNIELVCDVGPAVPSFIRGDPGRLRQVVTNLLGNALKFTHDGEVELSASVEGSVGETATITITVRDTGIGIQPDRLAAIFEEFSQEDITTTRRYGGTGLGLAISQTLVQRMGGCIEVQSQVGRGSEFSFTITCPVGSRPESVERTGRDVGLILDARILIVDDNATNRRVLGGILSHAGGQVEAVPSVAEGMAKLASARDSGRLYDLAVVDVYMPLQDGFQFIEQVRADTSFASTRLMMLTSGGQRGDGQRCRDLGVDAYLTKPLSRADLIEATAAALGGSQTVNGADLITRHTLEETRHRARILLAEDNPVNQQVAVAMLRKRGHEVHIVSDGRRAVESAATGHYDVILMDIQMPTMDGLQATSEIRKLPGYAKTPIVALTAHALKEERDKCLAAGMDEHLAKPFKAHELFNAVERWGVGVPNEGTIEASDDIIEAIPVDIEGFRHQMREAGVEDAVNDMLSVFLDDAPGRLSAVIDAVQRQDAGAIESAAHAFKSAAATIGAHELAALLKQLEHAGRDGIQQQWQALAEEVEAAGTTAIAFIGGKVSVASDP